MTLMYVNVESLNFRTEPNSADNSNRIGSLFLTHEVDVLAEAPDGWVQIRTRFEGATREGFVAGRFLRPPLTPNREKRMCSVHREFMRFDHGLGKEHVSPFAGCVG